MKNAVRKPLQHAGLDATLNRHQIFLPHFITRMRQAQGELSIIGKENKSFRVIIEPPHRIDAVPLFRQQIINSRTIKLILAGTNTPDRFVESYVELAFGAYGPAVHSDAIMKRINLGTELANDFA